MRILTLTAASCLIAVCHAVPSIDKDTLTETDLDMLHAEAVKAGTAGSDNIWFNTIDARLLDKVITDMNNMNKYFARIVKYWDEFTSGRDGSILYLTGLSEDAKDASNAAIATDDKLHSGNREFPVKQSKDDDNIKKEEIPAKSGMSKKNERNTKSSNTTIDETTVSGKRNLSKVVENPSDSKLIKEGASTNTPSAKADKENETTSSGDIKSEKEILKLKMGDDKNVEEGLKDKFGETVGKAHNSKFNESKSNDSKPSEKPSRLRSGDGKKDEEDLRPKMEGGITVDDVANDSKSDINKTSEDKTGNKLDESRTGKDTPSKDTTSTKSDDSSSSKKSENARGVAQKSIERADLEDLEEK